MNFEKENIFINTIWVNCIKFSIISICNFLELMKKELDEKINSLNIGNATTRKLLQCSLDSQHFEWG